MLSIRGTYPCYCYTLNQKIVVTTSTFAGFALALDKLYFTKNLSFLHCLLEISQQLKRWFRSNWGQSKNCISHDSRGSRTSEKMIICTPPTSGHSLQSQPWGRQAGTPVRFGLEHAGKQRPERKLTQDIIIFFLSYLRITGNNYQYLLSRILMRYLQ